MTISTRTAVLLCISGMAIVGSSVSISQLILDYPPLTGQAARYTAAALALFAISRRFPRLGAGAAAGRPARANSASSPRWPRPGWPPSTPAS